ncbi:serpin family protein [Verrucomicrobium sp. BvORR034]|uniref:serpin family protein n=1 Tax=Verrucomicrobium sp. BvORR034 TaxID=1396418 RepID=UPI0009DD5A9C|nr:serpin family protein [Verrucomicrobium sp. BvORR034]
MKVCSRWWLGWVATGLLGVLGSMSSQAETPRVGAQASNVLAFKLAPALQTMPDNYVMCPYALHRTLSLVLEGAEGKTREEMIQLLGWEGDAAARAAAVKRLGESLGKSAADGKVIIDSTMHLLIRKGVQLEDPFLDVAQNTYGVPPLVIKSDDPVSAVEGINELIRRGTRGRITNLVPPGGLVRDTNALSLVSTLYFKGPWADRFPAQDTVQRAFWVPSVRRDKQVMMMRRQGRLRHAKMVAQGYGLLELPMGDRSQDYSMLILLPVAQEGLPAVEKALTQAGLEEAIGKLESTLVTVHLPRFSFSLGGEFSMLLRALGAGSMITPKVAELGPMSRSQPLYLSGLYKETTVDVNEAGAEATAAIVAPADPFASGAPPEERGPIPVLFIANHPFLFYIRHRPSGLILVMGRVGNP